MEKSTQQKETRQRRHAKSPGQICVSPAEKTAKQHKTGPRLLEATVTVANSESCQACFVDPRIGWSPSKILVFFSVQRLLAFARSFHTFKEPPSGYKNELEPVHSPAAVTIHCRKMRCMMFPSFHSASVLGVGLDCEGRDP